MTAETWEEHRALRNRIAGDIDAAGLRLERLRSRRAELMAVVEALDEDIEVAERDLRNDRVRLGRVAAA